METLEKLKYKVNAGIEDSKIEYNNRISDKLEVSLKGLNNEKIYITNYSFLEKKANEIKKLYEKIPKNNRVSAVILLDAHASATIEGARTTVERIQKVINNPVSKDEKMVVNTIKGSKYAYSNQITDNNIRKLWDIVTKDVCENENVKGQKYRDGAVKVASSSKIIHEPARAEDIQQLMDVYFKFKQTSELEIFIKSIISHFYFVYVHPFCDGNGRIARILNASDIFHEGYKNIKGVSIVPTINDNYQGYYRALKESEILYGEKDKWIDLSPFIDYMLDILETSFIKASIPEKNLSKDEKIIIEKMKRQNNIAEITINKAKNIIGKSYETTRRILNGLANKGFLIINTEKKPYIYILEYHN